MDKPRHFEGMKFVPGGYVADHDEINMAFDPKRYDPDSCNKARDLLAEYRRPNGEIVLPLERCDRLQQAIAEAIHASRGVPKP